MKETWLEELREFIAIPSVSADPAHREDVRRAGEWVVELVKRAGGEAELGGRTVVEFLEQDDRGADACVIFDGGPFRAEQPEFAIATRGLVGFHVTVRTGAKDLHSGLYGGAALNAQHVLMQGLAALTAR